MVANGYSYVRLASYRSAIGWYQEAIRLKPDYAQAWWGLGGSYARSGNRSAASEAEREFGITPRLFCLPAQWRPSIGPRKAWGRGWQAWKKSLTRILTRPGQGQRVLG